MESKECETLQLRVSSKNLFPVHGFIQFASGLNIMNLCKTWIGNSSKRPKVLALNIKPQVSRLQRPGFPPNPSSTQHRELHHQLPHLSPQLFLSMGSIFSHSKYYFVLNDYIYTISIRQYFKLFSLPHFQ